MNPLLYTCLISFVTLFMIFYRTEAIGGGLTKWQRVVMAFTLASGCVSLLAEIVPLIVSIPVEVFHWHEPR